MAKAARGAGVAGVWHSNGTILCVGSDGWSLWNGKDARPEIASLKCSAGGDDAGITHVSFAPSGHCGCPGGGGTSNPDLFGLDGAAGGQFLQKWL